MYFPQACAAVKVGVAMKYADDSDLVFGLSTEECYREARKEGVPFHEVRQSSPSAAFW
jgi:hypothetical protein